ncbi:hypothetical protein DFH07DRAFT_1056151 [Mycena maculata]|uniref:DUF6699 domain-containing protein n=1 Tax=Mycena maculata TaxID=230809 RepID=A0AAD7NXB6_9AGAR|nr:hypothetical protein DFH07DRAFT_1056151 [Mycena maculata]
MASPGVTPFIPPLGTPAPSPNTQQPPLVPQAPTGPNQQYPAWATTPQGAGNYPIYPSTPYTPAAGTPYIPQQQTPQGLMPGYFPATGPPQPQMHLPAFGGGGYTPFGGGGWGPPPGTPWPGAGGGMVPPGTPWMSQGHPSPYAPVGGHPMAAFGPPPTQPRQGWGPPPGLFTPAAAADPWSAAPPPWAQAQMQNQQMQAQMGMMGGGMGPGMPGMMGGGIPMGGAMGMGLGFGPAGFGMPEQQQPLSRAIGQVGDRVGQFEAGPHYGPVLEPFLIRAVRAHVRLNPLVQPLPDTGGPQPYLKWNMLFPSNQCQRSDDAPHLSWSKGRQEPATFPRVTYLRLVSETFPWTINISARNRDIGVTCGELIDYLSRDMYQLTGQSEYEALSSARKRVVGEAYRHNRSRAHGVPGGQLNPGMLRLDWLGQDTMFGGVRENDRLVKRVCGDVLPCTFELVCVRRYPMTAEEIRNQEAMQRTLSRESERAARRRSHRATVEAVRDEDDGGEDDDDDDSEEEEEEGRRGRSRHSGRS